MPSQLSLYGSSDLLTLMDVCRRPRTSREGIPFCSLGSLQFRTQCHGPVSNLAECNAILMNHQRFQIRQIVFENRFFERSAKHGLLCQIQSRHLNILFWENLGNPDSCLRPRVRHHQSCLGSGTWVRLGKVTS